MPRALKPAKMTESFFPPLLMSFVRRVHPSRLDFFLSLPPPFMCIYCDQICEVCEWHSWRDGPPSIPFTWTRRTSPKMAKFLAAAAQITKSDFRGYHSGADEEVKEAERKAAVSAKVIPGTPRIRPSVTATAHLRSILCY